MPMLMDVLWNVLVSTVWCVYPESGPQCLFCLRMQYTLYLRQGALSPNVRLKHSRHKAIEALKNGLKNKECLLPTRS